MPDFDADSALKRGIADTTAPAPASPLVQQTDVDVTPELSTEITDDDVPF